MLFVLGVFPCAGLGHPLPTTDAVPMSDMAGIAMAMGGHGYCTYDFFDQCPHRMACARCAFYAVLAALCQGLTLGGLLQGIRVVDDAYAGVWWDWLTPFTVLCGIAVVVGYALLGATWLVWRTSGALHDRARRQAWWLGWATLGMIGAVSLWKPFLRGALAQRWFSWPGILLTSPVPALVVLLAVAFFRGLAHGRNLAPFLCALVLLHSDFDGLAAAGWL